MAMASSSTRRVCGKTKPVRKRDAQVGFLGWIPQGRTVMLSKEPPLRRAMSKRRFSAQPCVCRLLCQSRFVFHPHSAILSMAIDQGFRAADNRYVSLYIYIYMCIP
jgi:hypothetical protein